MFWPEIVYFFISSISSQKILKIPKKRNFSAKNCLDKEQYTLAYVFFGAESDFEVAFAPSVTVFRKKMRFLLKLVILTSRGAKTLSNQTFSFSFIFQTSHFRIQHPKIS